MYFYEQGRSYSEKDLEAHFTVLIESISGKEHLNNWNNGIWRSGSGRTLYRKDAKKFDTHTVCGIAALYLNPRKIHRKPVRRPTLIIEREKIMKTQR
jgi:hypothetical protein